MLTDFFIPDARVAILYAICAGIFGAASIGGLAVAVRHRGRRWIIATLMMMGMAVLTTGTSFLRSKTDAYDDTTLLILVRASVLFMAVVAVVFLIVILRDLFKKDRRNAAMG